MFTNLNFATAGVIDATEFSMPTMDTKLGFHQIAKFNYFPGWHQQTSVSELLMNKAAWEALSDQNKAIIEIALGESIMHTYVESDHAQFAAMAEMRDKHKVQIKRWSDQDLATLEKAWLEVLAEESAKETLRVSTGQYKFQAAMLSDVLKYQASLAEATNDYQHALLNFWTAKAEFEKALGEEK